MGWNGLGPVDAGLYREGADVWVRDREGRAVGADGHILDP